MISRRVKKVTPSLTLKITSLAKRMSQQGHPVVNFAAGEPDFDTPGYIKQAAVKAIKDGFTKYTPASGLVELKELIAQKLEQDNHLHFSPSQIVVTCGAKHALYNILQVLCAEKDEVVIASPYWVSYPQMVSLAGARIRFVQTHRQNQFKLDGRSLSANITKRTKVVILNSPGNPAGCVYSRQELKQIAAVILRHNLYLISDEIYEKLIFDGKQHISCASLNKKIYQRTIVVNGLSKAYAMTGWRLGYLASPEQKIIEAIGNLQSHSTSNPCSISQKAACAALSGKGSNRNQMRRMIQEFQARRDCMLEGLRGIGGLTPLKPQGAFYIFCNISKIGLNSAVFADRLLQEAKVAVIPGRAFGRDDYLRLSFATSRQQIREGIDRIRQWVTR